ncbi:hypothetical protein [Serratia proteamaculans]|uniref:hypothetical protein n=1 Tax=Serratia proteamaculans TaxID=28151 RepID=UPI00101F8F20|nr:hypothetical protein [Serratia proteamaculans]RYM51247.1 hypothetical protein BSQ97_10735 [Serratia proteamaculans]
MSWLGVPFLIDASDFISSSSIYINKVPEIVIDSVFDGRSLIAPILSAIIPGCIAAYALFQQNITIKAERESQLNIATETVKAQIVASSRQEWINRFSDLISDFVSFSEPLLEAKYEVKVATQLQRNISVLGLDAIKDSPELLAMLENANENLILKNKIHSEVRQQISSRLSRLKIMMNPEEEYCKKIMFIMDEMIYLVSKMKGYPEVNLPSLYSEMAVKTTALTKEVQGFLKSEWDKVKKAEL